METTAAVILTLDKCRSFISESLDTDDYKVLSGLCGFPESTIKKYIKEGTPNTAAARLLANRIVVHSIELIKGKANAQLNTLDNLLKDKQLPNLAA